VQGSGDEAIEQLGYQVKVLREGQGKKMEQAVREETRSMFSMVRTR
jgi:hypothetical protein